MRESPDNAFEDDGAPEPVEGELLPPVGESVPAGPEHLAEVRRLPVTPVAPGTELELARPVTVPAAVVAATGGFLLGVVTFVLMRVLRRPPAVRAVGRRRRRLGGRRRGIEVESTRSFLVDVHVLKR